MKRKIEYKLDSAELKRLRNDIIERMYSYPKGHPEIKKIMIQLDVINRKIENCAGDTITN